MGGRRPSGCCVLGCTWQTRCLPRHLRHQVRRALTPGALLLASCWGSSRRPCAPSVLRCSLPGRDCAANRAVAGGLHGELPCARRKHDNGARGASGVRTGTRAIEPFFIGATRSAVVVSPRSQANGNDDSAFCSSIFYLVETSASDEDRRAGAQCIARGVQPAWPQHSLTQGRADRSASGVHEMRAATLY